MIHAESMSGELRLVRYDRAGKWYVEDDVLGRSSVTLDQAVIVARSWERNGGKIHLGRYGGKLFDSRVRKAAAR